MSARRTRAHVHMVTAPACAPAASSAAARCHPAPAAAGCRPCLLSSVCPCMECQGRRAEQVHNHCGFRLDAECHKTPCPRCPPSHHNTGTPRQSGWSSDPKPSCNRKGLLCKPAHLCFRQCSGCMPIWPSSCPPREPPPALPSPPVVGHNTLDVQPVVGPWHCGAQVQAHPDLGAAVVGVADDQPQLRVEQAGRRERQRWVAAACASLGIPFLAAWASACCAAAPAPGQPAPFACRTVLFAQQPHSRSCP